MRRDPRAFLALCFVFGAAAAAGAAPIFTGLGDLPGLGFSSGANGISADGLVVVGFSTSTSGGEAFRWTETSGMVGLGDLAGGSFGSQAFAVSADGSVVVGRGFSTPGGNEAFRWTPTSGMVGLGDLAGGSFSSNALGVSADGSVVVGDSIMSFGLQPFRWTQAGGMVRIGSQPSELSARAVSSDGSVIVGIGNLFGNGNQAFRWTQAGGIVGLGSLPGGSSFSEAMAVSADGSVVAGRSSASPGFPAFLWTQAGGMVNIGDLPGSSIDGRPAALSADGSVVVGQGLSATGAEAFVWNAADGMQSVPDLLANSFGLDLTGWTLTRATGVSADGRTLVGQGTNPSGDSEAWLARVPLADEFTALAAGLQTTSLGGGTGTPGGFDITLDSPDGGTVIGEYFTPTVTEINEQFDLDQIPNFLIPGPSTAQFWDLDFVAGTTPDEFELVFAYDPSLLGGISETALIVLHLLEGGGAEIFRSGDPGFSIDAAANTITLTTSSLSPFVLGIVPEPGTGLLVALGLAVLGLRSRRILISQ